MTISRRTLLGSLIAVCAEELFLPRVFLSKVVPTKTPELLLDQWESIPTFWEWIDLHGHGSGKDHDRLVEAAYGACKCAVKRDLQNARLHFIFARLIGEGGGGDEVLLSDEILNHCNIAIKLKPDYHKAHALMAEHASFLSIAAADTQNETIKYTRIAIHHAQKAYKLQPHNDEYVQLINYVKKRARLELVNNWRPKIMHLANA